MELLTFEQLKQSGKKPRVHGNGFIQIDLPETGYRMNIWPEWEKRFDAQEVYTPWHNHRFSFESIVLCGCLIHTQYEDLVVCENGPYRMYEAVPKENEETELILTSPLRVDFKYSQRFFLGKGSTYQFPYSKFHKTEGSSTTLTATVMKKTVVDENITPRVLCKWPKEPDNDYKRSQIDEEKLWPFIKEVFDTLPDGELDLRYF